MDRLSRDLLQYLNLCLGLPLYAVEIDVFETEGRQLIVPRGVRYDHGRKPPKPPVTDLRTFLAACDRTPARFFELVVREAHERKLVVYWGVKGFSIRMPLEPAVTVMYGYPQDDFQVFTGGWNLSDEARAGFHKRLREEWGFRLSGQYTNKLPISEGTLKQAHAVLEFMWREVEEMMAEAHQDADSS